MSAGARWDLAPALRVTVVRTPGPRAMVHVGLRLQAEGVPHAYLPSDAWACLGGSDEVRRAIGALHTRGCVFEPVAPAERSG